MHYTQCNVHRETRACKTTENCSHLTRRCTIRKYGMCVVNQRIGKRVASLRLCCVRNEESELRQSQQGVCVRPTRRTVVINTQGNSAKQTLACVQRRFRLAVSTVATSIVHCLQHSTHTASSAQESPCHLLIRLAFRSLCLNCLTHCCVAFTVVRASSFAYCFRFLCIRALQLLHFLNRTKKLSDFFRFSS